jgi:hypothetical protein
MKNLILTFAILACSLICFSQQEKGTAQISALNVSATSATIDVASPSITYYVYENIGVTLGVANLEDVNIGAKYYVKENNYAFAGYGTNSQTIDIGLGKTYNWGEHVQIEPKLTLSDVLNDSRDLGLSVHLNLVF